MLAAFGGDGYFTCEAGPSCRTLDFSRIGPSLNYIPLLQFQYLLDIVSCEQRATLR